MIQAMVLTDCRDQLDSYGIDTALKYLEGKLTENALKRLLGENTMFNEVGSQCVLLVMQHHHLLLLLLSMSTAVYKGRCSDCIC